MTAHRGRARRRRPGEPRSGTPVSTAKKLGWSVFGLWLRGLIFFVAVFGLKPHKAPTVASGVFSPTDEFKLDTWFSVGPDRVQQGRPVPAARPRSSRSGCLVYVARRLQTRGPGRLQAAVEMFYDLTRAMATENMDDGSGTQVLPADRHAVRLHPRLEPDRLHPAAGRLEREVHDLRRSTSRRSRSTRPTRTSRSR